jgi:hypothetical protein
MGNKKENDLKENTEVTAKVAEKAVGIFELGSLETEKTNQDDPIEAVVTAEPVEAVVTAESVEAVVTAEPVEAAVIPETVEEIMTAEPVKGVGTSEDRNEVNVSI